MLNVNKRLIESIENSDYDEVIKTLLKRLLMIELRNFSDNNPRYSEDYDRVIKDLIGKG